MMNQDPSQGEDLFLSRRSLIIVAGLGIASVLTACSASSPEGDPTPLPSEVETSFEADPDATDPQTDLLHKYERETGVAPRMMEFIGFPQTKEDATALATTMAETLQTWHKAGVQPIVIMEPTFNGGQDQMDLEALGDGEYDDALDTFFGTLKEQGVTDEEMGMWVPLPEPNIPAWEGGVTDSDLFIANATTVAKTSKHYFPETPITVLLDSQTFMPSPNPDWTNGTRNPHALLQYLKFEPGLIDSFGLQGFTWSDTDTPETYLSAQAAIAGANQLGVENVWFNTGTYSIANNPDGKGVIKSTTEHRAQVLDGVLEQAVQAQDAGLKVDCINIFGKNTFDDALTGTGTADFRYNTPETTKVLKGFVGDAKTHDIPVTIYDAA